MTFGHPCPCRPGRWGRGVLLFVAGWAAAIKKPGKSLGEFVPYIMQERPELQQQFAGFTYYDNTISFGASTNFGAPALFGG